MSDKRVKYNTAQDFVIAWNNGDLDLLENPEIEYTTYTLLSSYLLMES